jgi:hypothetical protein
MWPGALQAKVPHVQGEGFSGYSWVPLEGDLDVAAWLLELVGPRCDSNSHIYRYAPAELLPVRYGEVVAD